MTLDVLCFDVIALVGAIAFFVWLPIAMSASHRSYNNNKSFKGEKNVD